MSYSLRQCLVFILCLSACSLTFVAATQASERGAHSVELTFYQLSTSEWNNKLPTFQSLVAAEAVTYCSNNAATCGLLSTSGFLFTTSQVGVSSGPTEESKSIKVKFYIDFPTRHSPDPASTTTYVVNSAAVTTIITNIREAVERGVGADMTYIGEEFYSIDPDSMANMVIIPIAFIILIAIIVLAIALHVWNSRKEKEEKKKQKALEREKRKKTSRITPVYTEETEAQKAKASWLRTLRKKKGTSFRQGVVNGNVPTLSMKTSMMTYNSSHTAEEPGADAASPPMYQDPVPLNTNALPPLPDPEGETQEQREKREKKEKRRRKREKRQRSAKKDTTENKSESEYSKTESLEKNIVPVEDK